ncbi:alpha/beta fold hydrolase [Magnetovibrio sp. PR-2]|uniref:alpha/beta fold hydrolase n=1 Tax=Magnetovibrio sp. PR-2 TaxID=3120356 RepID=UPI002FCDEC1E
MFIAAPGYAADQVGVVVLHGKWSTTKPKSPMGQLAAKLKTAGFLVALPSVAWSRTRYLDRDFDSAMTDIDTAVQRLKSQGATTIVVAGQSMGANAALGYGARRNGLAGVLALAPGHIPEDQNYQDRLGHAYKQAQTAVDAGQGDKVSGYPDINQGRKKTVSMTAKTYVSWFSPNGPAHMPNNTAQLKPGTALLWMVGTKDNMFKRGEAYAFANAPANPKNAYVVIDGASHRNTPMKGAAKVIQWLKGL